MCGISGIISKNAISQDKIDKATRIQKLRGPDSQNYKLIENKQYNIALCHQRLSIIDLNEHANQPFVVGEYTMVFNGEIYNYIELREELENDGIKFTTNSDTEVLLKSIVHYGLDSAVQKFNGMWAFVIFNSSSEEIYFSRDRFGIKPLYYHQDEESIYFASEIKTILKVMNSKVTINTQTVGAYIDQGILEGNRTETFYNEIKKLEPGHNAVLKLYDPQLKLDINKYYEIKTRVIDSSDIEKSISETFYNAVNLRLRSDVPVGVLLSGGLDSSAIAAIVNQSKGEGTNLLSYVSDNKEYNEENFIDIAAKHLNKDVTKVKINIEPASVTEQLRQTIYINDQPLHSFSALAHYLLMKKANELGLTVILSGQGADETLCGYRKYTMFYIKILIKKFRVLKAIQTVLEFIKNKTILNEFSFADADRYLPSFLRYKKENVLSDKVKATFKKHSLGLKNNETLLERQIRDVTNYSVPSLLHYEDRMSMANSREIRVPFLDHNVVELFLSLPIKYKIRKGWTKYGLRMLSKNLLPDEITWRKDKKGFTNPQKQWLKNELKEEVQKVFNNKDSLIFKFGLINQEAILKNYKDFCTNSKSQISEREIFAPFALNMWLEVNQDFIKS